MRLKADNLFATKKNISIFLLVANTNLGSNYMTTLVDICFKKTFGVALYLTKLKLRHYPVILMFVFDY